MNEATPIINRAQGQPPARKPSPLAAVWRGMTTIASRLVALERSNAKTAERLEALDDLVAHLRGIVDRARAARSDHALETVIAGLDATIQSLGAPRRIVRDAAGTAIGIEPNPGGAE